MRIASVTTSFPRDPGDFAGRFVHDLHAGLREEGHDVTTICPAAPGAPEREETEAGAVVRIAYAPVSEQDLFYGDGLEAGFRRTGNRWGKLGRFLTGAAGQLAAGAPADVYLAHWIWPSGCAAVAAARERARPVLGVGHGGDLHLLGRPLLGRWLARKLKGRFHAAVCTSRRGATIVARRLGVARVAVAPMGADPACFNPGAGPPLPGWPVRYLLGVGRLVRLKGFDLLVAAAARLAVPVVIAGDGPERAALERLAAASGAQLILAGRLGPAAVARAMAHAAAVVVPSRTLRSGRTEGSPVTAVEALLCGAPVVAAAVGGLPDLLPAGQLFPAGDEELLVARLRSTLAAGRRELMPRPGLTRRETARTVLALL